MTTLTKLLVSLGVTAEECQERLKPHIEASERELCIAIIGDRVADLQDRLAIAEAAPPVDDSLAVRALQAIVAGNVSDEGHPWSDDTPATGLACGDCTEAAKWALKQPDKPAAPPEPASEELKRLRLLAEIVASDTTAASEDLLPGDWPRPGVVESLLTYGKRLARWVLAQNKGESPLAPALAAIIELSKHAAAVEAAFREGVVSNSEHPNAPTDNLWANSDTKRIVDVEG